MTRSIDNAFVRALSKKRPVQLDAGTTGDGDSAATPKKSTDNSARIELTGSDAFIRIEQPTAGESPVSGPHLSFKAEPRAPASGGSSSTDLSAFLSFSADTQTTFSADAVPFPSAPVSPASPPQPHIATPAATPQPPTQNTPEPETKDSDDTPDLLNETAVERILRQREGELNSVFQRRFTIRSAEPARQMEQVDAAYHQTTLESNVVAEVPDVTANVVAADIRPMSGSETTVDELADALSVAEAATEMLTTELPSTELPSTELPSNEDVEEAAFQPDWEVDVFQWPETVEELLRDQGIQFAQAGDQLRHAAAEGLQVLGVTSTFRGEGRTSLSMCIARCVASAGAKVVLVDMDADHADLATTLRVRPPVGWREAIEEQLPIEEAIIHSVNDGVSLVSLESGGGAEIGLRDPQVAEFIQSLRQHYELVLLDCGPLVDESKFLEGGDDCPLNAAIVVRDLRTTSVEDCQKTVARLLLHGVEAVGIAENFMR